jgi:NAD(P)-dependent dehydrogenase (short-subunit alcohol dehydrogenase family)
MDLQLDSRVILVAGGNGYIGRAVVDRLRSEGATAIVASRTSEEGVRIDGRDADSVRKGLASVLAEHGRLDGLVVTAAPSARTLDPSRNSAPDQVLDAFDAKSLTFLRLASEALPIMRDAGFGRVVGVSGQNAWVTGSITGSVRNAALNIAAKNLADDYAGTGVTVNTVNPGVVADEPETAVERGVPGQSSPQEIADLIAFLLSPLSSTSGESIAVGHRVRGANHY